MQLASKESKSTSAPRMSEMYVSLTLFTNFSHQKTLLKDKAESSFRILEKIVEEAPRKS